MQAPPQHKQPSNRSGSTRGKRTLRIVGIGASAGGLEAFTQFLQAVPSASNMAFVLVQHLDPTHESGLVDLLALATNLPVTEIVNGCKIEPNHVYIIPSDADLTIKNTKLCLHPRTSATGPHLPIDRFLTSLAEDQQANAIGVVLSGAASDGTLGLQAIKAAGGITFAQDESADYTSMPESAIRSGAADFVLPPAEIARAIDAVNSRGHGQEQLSKPQPESADDFSGFHEILQLLENQTGVAMASYKVGTLQRRIQRRLAVLDIPTLAKYTAYIRDNPTEAAALYQDMLINVTSFFRDQPTLDFLKQQLLPELLDKTTDNQQLRIWVAGCASGEEAYSLAIVCREFLDQKPNSVTVKIFATDLNAAAIAQARSGNYTEGALTGVSKSLRERYFSANGANYQVIEAVRNMCVFAAHNLLVDPPFLSMDFISCCNVLIYLKPIAQQKLFASFHYALKPSGFLALGTSESVGESRSLFSQLDKSLKVYSRKPVPSPRRLFTSNLPAKSTVALPSQASGPNPYVAGTATLADSVLLSQFTPASVVVDSSLDIIQFHGSTSPYLEAAPGKASLNLFKMARPGLVLHLRKAIRHVKEKKEPYERTVHVKLNAKTQIITLHALPLAPEDNAESSILIVFSDNPDGDRNGLSQSTATAKKTNVAETADDSHQILQLERELAEQQDEMRRLGEDQEIANEELQLANEEVRSSNEELQSLNEELETSSEELASTNEELVSMNQTLRASNEALAASRDYAEAIIATVREPLLVLSSDLRVVIANESFYRVFKVSKQATEGSPLYQLGNGQWRIPKLQSLLEDILSKNNQFQDYQVNFDFPDIGPKTMLLDGRRIHSDKVDDQLILLAIEDITERQQAQQTLQATADRLQFMAESMPQKVFTADRDGAIGYFNPQWTEFTGIPIDQITGWGWTQFIHPDDLDETVESWKHSVASGEPYELEHRFRRADGEYHWHLSRAHVLHDNDGKVVMWVGSCTDVEDFRRTKQRSAELERTAAALELQRNQLLELNKAKDEFINLASHQLRTPATGVKQYVSMVLGGFAGEITSTQREYLDQANESNDRQLRIIEDLLKVARVDSGLLTLDKTPTDLVLLLKSILREQAAGFADRQQRSTFKHTTPSVVASVDNRRMRMVLENLIDNASKYTNSGKLITVELSQRDAETQISITDEGVGIAAADVSHLFQKFSRLDNQMSVLVGGSGLGLYWAKKIVDLHSGSISVDSTVGKGSTFTVTLPTDSGHPRHT